MTQPAGTSPAGEDWDEMANGLIRSMTPMAGSRRWRSVAERRHGGDAGACNRRSLE
jgi:hypothetical protein